MSALTSSPVSALMPGSHLLVGAIRDLDGSLRIYLGARSAGIHTHMPASDAADSVERAWLTATSHLWLTDVPPDALCACEVTR